MKTKLIGVALFAATASVIAFYPALKSDPVTGIDPIVATIVDPGTNFLTVIDPVTNARPKIEVVFVLDTTGSMSGLIEAAKEKIWSIATTMAQAEQAPEIRMGLVAYRDRGDAYVTQVVDLSDDLDSMYARLMDFRANGGGDGPESVNKALYDAVHGISWSQSTNAYKVVFLIGDAPPHMDYHDEVQYPETIKAAKARGIVVNAIQAGQNPATMRQWRHIAALSQGDFFNVAQDGNAVAVATPYDADIAKLSAAMDDTRLYFGTEEEKAKQRLKKAATAKLHASASDESRARRAAFNASASGKRNFLGDKELVDAVVSGRVDMADMDAAELPAMLQALAPEERKSVVMEQAAMRSELEGQIKELAKKRDSFIAEKVEADGGAEDSLDHKIYRTVKRQAAAVGLSYEEAAPKY
ncbi:MAG: VWA domain-containing protein [Proteobacteria bacterium]|nr:VWA domain-containing protein [Pseudomonadota bacterium]